VPGRPRRGQRMGEPIGIGDVDASLRKRVGDDRLSAADPAGQSDDKAHGKNILTSGSPKNKAIAPAIAR